MGNTRLFLVNGRANGMRLGATIGREGNIKNKNEYRYRLDYTLATVDSYVIYVPVCRRLRSPNRRIGPQPRRFGGLPARSIRK